MRLNLPHTVLVEDLLSEPDQKAREYGDIVAVGGDVTADSILRAYSRGIFPMAMLVGEPDDDPGADTTHDGSADTTHDDGASMLAWWSPLARGVLPLGALKVSRSLAKSCRRFHVTVDRNFEQVLRACADPNRDGVWIEDDFLAAYRELHERGYAHSVETRTRSGSLVGGLICVEQGGLVNGDSMFHWESDASKVALVALVRLLCAAPAATGLPTWLGGRLLDVQWTTDHLSSLGAVDLPRGDYVSLLPAALSAPPALAEFR